MGIEKLTDSNRQFSKEIRPSSLEGFGKLIPSSGTNDLTRPNNSLFEVVNPFATSGNLAIAPETISINDDDFGAEVISFEERSSVVTNLTTKKERVLEGSGKVISFFKEAADYKLKNMNDFRTLADQAAVMARLSAAACAPGDGHGVSQNSSSLNSAGELSISSNVSSIFSKGGHKEGKHDHCSKCGGDLNDGKCSNCS